MEKTSFQVFSKIEPLYTGGQIVVSDKGDFFVCACTDEVLVVECATGKVLQRMEGDTSVITSLALSPVSRQLVTCSRNLLIKLWDIQDIKDNTDNTDNTDNKDTKDTKDNTTPAPLVEAVTRTPVRTWRGHTAPVISASVHAGGTLVATASVDHTVKVWAMSGGYCTHNFQGHKGVVNLVRFNPSSRSRLLFSADDQCEIRVWNLDKPTETVALVNHMSLVTGFAFNISSNILYSAGHDKVLNVWDLETKKLKKTLISFEEEHSMVNITGEKVVLPAAVQAKIDKFRKQHSTSSSDLLALGGINGRIRLWCVDPVSGSGECVWRDGDSQEDADRDAKLGKSRPLIESLHWSPAGLLASASSDQSLVFYDLHKSKKSIKKSKQFAGFLDSVLDLKFLDRQCTKVVAATNSHDLVVLGVNTHQTTFMSGHTDVVLTVDVSRDGKWILSGSRDHTVRLWDATTLECVAVGKGHTDPVSSVAFGRKAKTNIFASASQDRTLKAWNIDATGDSVSVTGTTRAHDKDINTVDISPNEKLIATGSQDKTIKLWNSSTLKQVGVLNGHRRGVWHVRFSPVDQCLASASSDNTIRIWSISNFNCLKTLEGHAVSVLRVEFLTHGTQLLSTGGDGVLKLWSIKSAECVMTEEAHADKAWALSVGVEAKPEDAHSETDLPSTLRIATGGADSTIKVWSDCSLAVETDRKQKEEQKILIEQKLNNSLANKDYYTALVYALSLGHKGKALDVLDAILVLRDDKTKDKDDNTESLGQTKLMAVVKQLSMEQVAKCLLYIRDWNTIGKYSAIAQQFLHAILRVHPLKKIIEMSPTALDLPTMLQGVIPYTDKHFNRIDKLIQSSYILDFTIKSIANNPDMDITEQL